MIRFTAICSSLSRFTMEKTYIVSNLYLKFSELQLLDGDDKLLDGELRETQTADYFST